MKKQMKKKKLNGIKADVTRSKTWRAVKWEYKKRLYTFRCTRFRGSMFIQKHSRSEYVLCFKNSAYGFRKLSTAKKVAQLIHEG